MTMQASFKEGFDFALKFSEDLGLLSLKRKNGQQCYCPYNQTGDDYCGSQCPHFVVENCSIVDKKCCLVLTCGKHLSRVVEIL